MVFGKGSNVAHPKGIQSKDFDNTISFTALGNTHVFSTYAGTLPAPTPKAGFPEE